MKPDKIKSRCETIYSLNISSMTKPQLSQLMTYIEHFDDDTNNGWHYYGDRQKWDKRHSAIMDEIVPQLQRICWADHVKISRKGTK